MTDEPFLEGTKNGLSCFLLLASNCPAQKISSLSPIVGATAKGHTGEKRICATYECDVDAIGKHRGK